MAVQQHMPLVAEPRVAVAVADRQHADPARSFGAPAHAVAHRVAGLERLDRRDPGPQRQHWGDSVDAPANLRGINALGQQADAHAVEMGVGQVEHAAGITVVDPARTDAFGGKVV